MGRWLAGVGCRFRCLVGGWLADRLVGWLVRSFIRSLSRSVWSSVALPRPFVGSSLGCFAGSLVCVGRCFFVPVSCPTAPSMACRPPSLVSVCPARSRGCSFVGLLAWSLADCSSRGPVCSMTCWLCDCLLSARSLTCSLIDRLVGSLLMGWLLSARWPARWLVLVGWLIGSLAGRLGQQRGRGGGETCRKHSSVCSFQLAPKHRPALAIRPGISVVLRPRDRSLCKSGYLSGHKTGRSLLL